MPSQDRNLRAKVHKVIGAQSDSPPTVLSSLLAIQDSLGYIPEVAMEEVASCTAKTVNDVWGVASFYLNFRFTPPGKHTVEVCWGPTCQIMGAMEIAQGLLDYLGLDNEGDTPSRDLTLKLNTCLGACPQGPVISVDEHLKGRMTFERAKEILQDLQGYKPTPERASS